jgi:hypothetical protein
MVLSKGLAMVPTVRRGKGLRQHQAAQPLKMASSLLAQSIALVEDAR